MFKDLLTHVCRLGLMQTMCWPTHSDMIFFPDVERNLRCIRTGIDNEHGVSKKLGDCRGDLWQFASSYFHPWVAFGTSDGWFKMINNYHGHKRGERSIVINVYRMKLQEGPPKKYQYVDGIKPVVSEIFEISMDLKIIHSLTHTSLRFSRMSSVKKHALVENRYTICS